MKVELGDNAVDGIRFLLLGVGVLLFLRLAYAGLALWIAPPVTTDLAVAIDGFRNGYLLSDRNTLVVGGRPLMERMALAVLAAASGGLLIAIPAWFLGPVLGRSPLRSAISAGRLVLFVTFAWWCFAALAVPPVSVEVSNTEFVRTERSALFQELSIPFTGTESGIPRSASGTIQQRSGSGSWSPCDRFEEVFTQYGSEQMVIARAVPSGEDCSGALSVAQERTRTLVDLLLGEAGE